MCSVRTARSRQGSAPPTPVSPVTEVLVRIGILASVAWRVPPRNYGGWETVAHRLTERLVRRGHEVTLFATADSVTSARLCSVVPRPLEEDRSLPSRVYETLHVANAYEHARELDVLHNHTGVYGTALSRLVSIPVVTTLHGSAAEEDSRLVYSHFKEQPYVSITDAERALAPELNYTTTVYNGVEVESMPAPASSGEYLLFLGRLSPQKGVHLAVQVALLSGRPLVISGIIPDSNREYYASQVAPYVDGKSIQYIGPSDARQRNELMRGAYAFLHLVTYHEAFGLTMTEAMAVGTPVIATGLGSVPEVVLHGETGFIVRDVAEAVEALAKVPALSRGRCIEWVSDRFSADRMVDGYERVYESLVRG